MADMLASPPDLALMPGMGNVTEPLASLLIEIATAVVQAESGNQRIVAVANDSIELLGTTDAWLDLPERPVTGVSLVEIDGQEVTDYKRFGARLWRSCGWALCAYEPSTVAVTNSHGYAEDEQGIHLARGTVLALCAAYLQANPGVTSESIDDYQVVYNRMAAELEATAGVKKRLRRTYGRRGGIVRVG